MDDVIERIDARLAETRKTWADLGRAVGASDQRTYNWRSRGLPKSALKPVAEFLGWTVDQLLTGQGPKSDGETAHTAYPPFADTMPEEVKDLANRMAKAMKDGRMTPEGMDLMRRMLDQITKENDGAQHEKRRSARS